MAPQHIPVEPLDWFPKKFTPGDMDATGGERLLGRTELSALEVLLRETAQNSWDARLDNLTPQFGVHLRTADFRLRGNLGQLLPVRDRSSPLSATTFESSFVLEIFDRGTSGLDGPVTLRPVHGDKPRNFQDLILKVGVPRDDGKGGGTYGFGKTASYAFSEVGTVLYWTRCRNETGQLEHRFIASAFRSSYTEAGTQFTGRHWWAHRGDDDAMLPVIGAAAEALGRRFFERQFIGSETGTSMLIIEPTLDDESLGEEVSEISESPAADDRAAVFTRNARTALRHHLWPKLIALPQTGRLPMAITLETKDQLVPLVDSPTGALDLWGAGLNAIRAARQNSEQRVTTPQGLPVDVFPITRHRQTLGHLAIVKRILLLEPSINDDDLDPTVNSTLERIALMRGQPELIVGTVDWVSQTPIEGLDWVAVYKSTDEFDAAYARTEPPAHDAWVASAGGEDGLIVRATKNRVSKIIREELYPEPIAVEIESRTVPTGALARRFASMLPAAAPSTPDGPTPTGRRRQRAGTAARAPKVDISRPQLVGTLEDGRQRQRVDFTVRAPSTRATVTLNVSAIGDQGLHEPLSPEELAPVWTGASTVSPTQALIEVGSPVSVEFTGSPRRALRIDLSAEERHGEY